MTSTDAGRTLSACGRHHHRTIAAMCMPALHALATAAVAMSVAEAITRNAERGAASWSS